MLDLPKSIERGMVEDARAAAPEECCGVLGGRFDANRSRVDSRYPTRNVATEPRREYRIDPEEQLAVFEELEDRGEEIVGFYHSHPRGPFAPSETDVAGAAWPNRSYVIVSLEGDFGEPAIGSWRWRDDGDRDRDREHDNEHDDGGRFVLETIERP
ncbi:desampylase [Natrialbaceae archaeon A-CW3]